MLDSDADDLRKSFATVRPGFPAGNLCHQSTTTRGAIAAPAPSASPSSSSTNAFPSTRAITMSPAAAASPTRIDRSAIALARGTPLGPHKGPSSRTVVSVSPKPLKSSGLRPFATPKSVLKSVVPVRVPGVRIPSPLPGKRRSRPSGSDAVIASAPRAASRQRRRPSTSAHPHREWEKRHNLRIYFGMFRLLAC